MTSYNYNLGLWFDEIASQNCNKEALIFPDGSTVSFTELNSNANKIANYLLSTGVKKYDVVSIAGVKKIHTYETLLACLKLGVTYSFFDPESPLERLEKILQQCKPVVVAGYFNEVDAVLDKAKWKQIDLSSDQFKTSFEKSSNKSASDVTVEGSCAAYIMFTSGSTGFPKGAVMTHANVINFIQWGKKTFDITPSDRHTNVNPLYFDNSVFDLYCSMFNGAGLVPITKNEAVSPKVLLNILSENKCTIWFSVPSLLIYLQTSRAIIADKWASVKKISFGGEGYPKGKLVNLYNTLKHNTKIYNVYGPTECTCICSSYEVSDSDFKDLAGFLPLGQMAENFSYYIVDENNKITDDKGDLLLGGPNVGLGYFN
ncbi:MAG: long-chain fatty acid--CoA ligase, partial [Bacteroidia bacterium]